MDFVYSCLSLFILRLPPLQVKVIEHSRMELYIQKCLTPWWGGEEMLAMGLEGLGGYHGFSRFKVRV